MKVHVVVVVGVIPNVEAKAFTPGELWGEEDEDEDAENAGPFCQ